MVEIRDTAQEAEFRHEVREWIGENLPSVWNGLGALAESERVGFNERWRKALYDRGFLAPSWPQVYGGLGGSIVHEAIVAEECVKVGLSNQPLPNDPFNFLLLAPTLMEWATDEQKRSFLPRMLAGEMLFCQGYSEPNAGSDLFALSTRAIQEGNGWVINGQKIWQTHGLSANWIFALVRTEADTRGASGLTFMLIPLDQPGVEVRGIVNMTGETEFAEVFFTDARTSDFNVIGTPGNGARVALTLLGFERGAGGLASAAAADVELRRVIDLAQQTGRSKDPLIRQRIAQCWTTVHVLRCLGLKVLSDMNVTGAPGPESSITKLMTAEYEQAVTELAVDILGHQILAPTGARSVNALGPQPMGLDPMSSRAWVEDLMHARPGTIYGGSSEIQRNTIAEQVLGLPRERRADR